MCGLRPTVSEMVGPWSVNQVTEIHTVQICDGYFYGSSPSWPIGLLVKFQPIVNGASRCSRCQEAYIIVCLSVQQYASRSENQLRTNQPLLSRPTAPSYGTGTVPRVRSLRYVGHRCTQVYFILRYLSHRESRDQLAELGLFHSHFFFLQP